MARIVQPATKSDTVRFEVAAQAEAVEPEVAESAEARHRATADLCTEFWERAAADGLVPDVPDARYAAVVTDLVVCADTAGTSEVPTAGPHPHTGHSSSTP